MRERDTRLLRALSALLSYPTAALRDALPEIAAAVAASRLPVREREEVASLVRVLACGDLLDAEERYVETFDGRRATSLHLFDHLHGDSRERGAAMIDLKNLYARSGFEIANGELPDFLPVLIEYLSCCGWQEARRILGDCVPVLQKLAGALLARESPYAAVPQALIVLAGEKPVAAGSAPRESGPLDGLDPEPFDPPAFGEAAPPLRA